MKNTLWLENANGQEVKAGRKLEEDVQVKLTLILMPEYRLTLFQDHFLVYNVIIFIFIYFILTQSNSDYV